MSRDPLMRLFIGEAPQTLRSAIETLDDIEQGDANHAARISKLRHELTMELDRVRAEQGSLF